MSNQSITYLVGACCGVFSLTAYVTAYSRMWERVAAAFLTLYALAAFMGLGLLGGAGVIWFWDRITA